MNAFTVADVLSEDTVLKWYKGGHAAKGKSVFLEQMKKMVEWLQSAEEGKYTFHLKMFFALRLVVLDTKVTGF